MKNTEQTFLDYLFGTQNYSLFFVCMFFGILTFVIKMNIESKKGVKKNDISPSKFSWNYWVKDGNLWRFCINIACIFVLIRFIDFLAGETFLKKYDYVNNPNVRVFSSAIIGFCLDFIINKLRQFGLFGSAESKLEQPPNE